MTKKTQITARAYFIAFCVIFSPVAVLANNSVVEANNSPATLNVAPVTVDIPLNQKSGLLRLTNTSEREVAVQLRLYKWSQDSGTDELSKTDKMAISPGIARIPANSSQVFRTLAIKPQGSAESAYRVIIDELPNKYSTSSGPQVLLRFSVPIFVNSARDEETTNNKLRFEHNTGYIYSHNDGDTRIKMRDAHLQFADGSKTRLLKDGPGYILSSSKVRWTLAVPLTCMPAGTYFIADSDRGKINAPINPDC